MSRNAPVPVWQNVQQWIVRQDDGYPEALALLAAGDAIGKTGQLICQHIPFPSLQRQRIRAILGCWQLIRKLRCMCGKIQIQ